MYKGIAHITVEYAVGQSRPGSPVDQHRHDEINEEIEIYDRMASRDRQALAASAVRLLGTPSMMPPCPMVTSVLFQTPLDSGSTQLGVPILNIRPTSILHLSRALFSYNWVVLAPTPLKLCLRVPGMRAYSAHPLKKYGWVKHLQTIWVSETDFSALSELAS